ncbi:single-stranded-DNA-specific exonuclease RecJ [Candidatus Peregrinibacteria bacterium]|jgi:single-stranded-DNA-specific exonuclease|nr:single-stranded-DNA-specific exonuclease RecJ [Candidatus Peregrinibacteria bacterium]
MGFYFDTWILKEEREKSSLKELILKSQGIKKETDIKKVLEKKFPEDMHDPKLLKDYQKSIDRIVKAIDQKERIIIFGDYDVDGTVGTTILYSLLEKVGALASYRIPHRKKHGYGLKKSFIDELSEKNIGLIITVDNGISAIDEVAYAKEKNIDIIITDHHLPGEKTPDAYAIVNHKQKDCHYPFPELCGAALAYKVALGIAKHYLTISEYEGFAYKMLDLAALATVADCMPIKGENHLIVKEGLKVLKTTKHEGIKKLASIANINLENATAETFGFQIGPRINAAGRLSEAYIGVQFLLGKAEFAEELERLNNERKEMVEQALQAAEKYAIPEEVIIASSKNWHTGIIGLIAGKLTEKYYLPAIILEEQEGKMIASCRAPEGFDMHKFLSEFSQYFEHFGGHAQAAGFSILKEKYLDFQTHAKERGKEILQQLNLKKVLTINAEIFITELDMQTFDFIDQFAPFGIGNEKPLFLLKNISSIQWSFLGKDNKHIQGRIMTPSGEKRIIKFFSEELIDSLEAHLSYDIVFRLSKNSWRGNSTVQLDLIDLRKS